LVRACCDNYNDWINSLRSLTFGITAPIDVSLGTFGSNAFLIDDVSNISFLDSVD